MSLGEIAKAIWEFPIPWGWIGLAMIGAVVIFFLDDFGQRLFDQSEEAKLRTPAFERKTFTGYLWAAAWVGLLLVAVWFVGQHL